MGIGDSIAEGHPNYHGPEHLGPSGNTNSQMYPHLVAALTKGTATYYNAGIGGQNAAQVDARIAALLTSKAPRVVILHVGINDIWQDVTWSSFQTSLNSILSKCTAAGAKLVVDEILPDCESSCHMCTDIPLWNGYLATWATANNVTLVPLYTAFHGTGGCLSASYDAGDLVHPNVAGYTLLGQTVAPYVEKILFFPASINCNLQ